MAITSDNIPLSEPNQLEIGTHSFELSHSDRERFHAVSLLRPFWLLSASASGHYADISRVDQFFRDVPKAAVSRCNKLTRSLRRYGGAKPTAPECSIFVIRGEGGGGNSLRL